MAQHRRTGAIRSALWRYAFDGDPRTFVEYMQGSCHEGTPPAGDPCDPTPFQP